MIYLSLSGLGAGPVTPHPLAAVAEPSLPGQAPGDLQGPSRTLQESGPPETRVRAEQGKPAPPCLRGLGFAGIGEAGCKQGG